MSREYEIQIANTIVQQIPVMEKMAVGYRNHYAMSESEDRLGGLSFQVNKGRRYVDVELAHNDTYTVKYYRVRKTKTSIDHVTLAEASNVYCDDLGVFIYDMTQKTDEFNKSN